MLTNKKDSRLNVNEYTPRGGWIKWNKRRRTIRKIKEAAAVWLGVLLLVAAFAAVGYIERGMQEGAAMATKTQKEKIREYLLNGGSLTPLDALNLFGCFRLATRIFELKREGLDIATDIVEDDVTGKRYAKYRLAGEKSAENDGEKSYFLCGQINN